MADTTENTDLAFDPTHVTHIRAERPAEVGVINALVMQAFADLPDGDGHQSFVVEKLRNQGQLTFSFVSINEGRPVGHIAVFPVEVTGEDGKSKISGVYALGPVAVMPDLQGAGHGSALVNHAIGALHGLGAKGVVVYGDREFFARFGFTPAKTLEYPGRDSEQFQTLSLDGEGLPTGTVKFPNAYEGK